MTITFTNPPTLPSLSDPANFNDRALGLFSWLTGTFIPELEAVEGLIPDGGDFAVDGNTLYVDVSTDRVGFGTSTPAAELDVDGDLLVRGGEIFFNTSTTAGDYLKYETAKGLTYFENGSEVWRLSSNNLSPSYLAMGGENVGIGTTTPSEKLDVVGNVTISGSLSKGSGSFKIDHPIKPETHHLVHSFIEGPQADNIYRGRVTLVAGGATVNLDMASHMTEGTFAALNGNVQCFTTNEDGWTAIRGKVQGNLLTIEAQDPTCTDEVSWMVIGERHDQHMIDASWTDENGKIIVEPEKPEPVEE